MLLPEDPDASARAIRAAVRDRTGRNVGVVVTDTAGRAWREGQTDIAIGAAGLQVLEQYAGRTDAHGNELAVTAPAVADEIAGRRRAGPGQARRPAVRGPPRPRRTWSCRRARTGRERAALVRPDGADMFGYGSREAVVAALRGDDGAITPFGSPVSADELVAVLAGVFGGSVQPAYDGDTVRCAAGAVGPTGGGRGRVRPRLGNGSVAGHRRSRVPPGHSVDSALDTDPEHLEEADPWPSPPRLTASRSSTRSAPSRRAPRSGAAS